MKFSYDYSYLSIFMKSIGINKKNMLSMLGITDYHSLKMWMDGKLPMPLPYIIKVCNFYPAILDNFFCDDDSPVIDNGNDGFLLCSTINHVEIIYNPNFLLDFRNQYDLTKKDYLEAFGTSDYASINRWMNGEQHIPVCAMLRFCNYYGIPLSGFFSGYNISPKNKLKAQKLPTGDYGLYNGTGRIVRTIVDTPSYTSVKQRLAKTNCLEFEKDYYSKLKPCLFNAPLPREKNKKTDKNTEDHLDVEAMGLVNQKYLQKCEAYQKENAELRAENIKLKRQLARMQKMGLNQDEQRKFISKDGFLNKISEGGHLDCKDLLPDQKLVLWEVMIRHGATQAWAYDRFFKEGFRKWELIGINKIKDDFINEHKAELWHNYADAEIAIQIQNTYKKGEFYMTLSRAQGLKKILREEMNALGMGGNSVLNKFSTDSWKEYELKGVYSLIDEFYKVL